jgi:3-oxo-5-alpha-steroid 4-dehydrogenase 1
MTELEFHRDLGLAVLALAVPVFAALLWTTAPYGRHARAGWGPTLPARTGWIVMESPAALLFAVVYCVGDRALDAVPLSLLLLWEFHYLNRAFVYPLRMPPGGRNMPVTIVALAFLFNVVNAYLNARWISQFGAYPHAWLGSPQFVAGALLFVGGVAINRRADAELRALRVPGGPRYSMPVGGLFRHVSCPNYSGEMLAWAGWALATWSLAGLAFAVFTAANLLPRALAHHRWYRRTFPDYPAGRRAVIPFVL